MAENMTVDNGFLFDWEPSYDMGKTDFNDLRPLYWIEMLEDDELTNLDSELNGGGAQSSEFYNEMPVFLYTQTPWGATGSSEAGESEDNTLMPFLNNVTGIEGLQDAVRTFDINGPYTDKATCAAIGLRDMQYKNSIKVVQEQADAYSTIRYRSEIRIKYITPRLR